VLGSLAWSLCQSSFGLSLLYFSLVMNLLSFVSNKIK
jgi:hypothetical protein